MNYKKGSKKLRKKIILKDGFDCQTCGYILGPQAGQTKCPNCDSNPYIPPESYTKDEWNGRQTLKALRKLSTQTLPA